MSKRIFLSLSDAQFDSLETAREQLGMKRSRYIQYLIRRQNGKCPSVLKYQSLIMSVSMLERDLKLLVMKETLSEADRLYLFQKLQDLEELLSRTIPE